MKKIMSALLCSAMMTGCTSLPPQTYDPDTKAKIRLFGSTTIHPDKQCYPYFGQLRRDVIRSGSAFDPHNKRVGMPPPINNNSRYNEFVFSANKYQTVVGYVQTSATWVQNAYGSPSLNTTVCDTGLSFIPKPGHMYEVSLTRNGRYGCNMELIDITNGMAAAQPVRDSKFARLCGSKK